MVLMACGSCNAKRKYTKFKWVGTDKDGNTLTVVYDTEIQAKAKVLRKGGSYTPLQEG